MIFSQLFITFLEKNNLPLEYYQRQLSIHIPRYVRLSPKVCDVESSVENIEKELKCKLQRIEWFPGFYSLPPQIKLSTCSYYDKGLLYGMDIASGIAVKALSIQPNNHILDICCAPGAKLCYMSEILSSSLNSTGSVTGVDISEHRLFTCKSLMRKYGVEAARLFSADGTTFNVHAPTRVGKWSAHLSGDVTIPQIVKPFHATRILRSDLQLQFIPETLYDRVLVDAECTHDGSIAHIRKYDYDCGPEKFDELVLDKFRLDSLQELQLGLLSNGFRLLKPGGILVYSTCSFFQAQNEDIVTWFLSQEKDAFIEEIPNQVVFPASKSEILGHALKFSPEVSNTSGLFIARIRKRILTFD